MTQSKDGEPTENGHNRDPKMFPEDWDSEEEQDSVLWDFALEIDESNNDVNEEN